MVYNCKRVATGGLERILIFLQYFIETVTLIEPGDQVPGCWWRSDRKAAEGGPAKDYAGCVLFTESFFSMIYWFPLPHDEDPVSCTGHFVHMPDKTTNRPEVMFVNGVLLDKAMLPHYMMPCRGEDYCNYYS